MYNIFMARTIENRKARHLYEIEETLEAGLVLTGSEVKSLRQGKAQIQEAYARIKDGEAWLIGAHIAPYEYSAHFRPDPSRSRKLLLKRQEIDSLKGRIERRGMTLIPLRIYFNRRNFAKVLLGLARGRKTHDRRQLLKERDLRRRLERALGRNKVRGRRSA